VTELARSLALRLLNGYENHVSAAIFWREVRGWGQEQDVQGVSGLHCIAYWGIEEIAVSMLEMEWCQVNGCDSRGRTPLMWAVECGSNRMVELFLAQRDIEPDMAATRGCSALSLAV